ncbi:phage protein NinX family protein [Cronobacter turicensis]
MDYSQLSDFEINGMVASLTQSPGDHTQTSNKTFIHEYAEIGGIKGLCIGWKEFDPCNNPADAWPIIHDNRISLVVDDTTDEWSSALVNDFSDDIAFQHSNANKNPLRAAMITFLLMQESQDA